MPGTSSLPPEVHGHGDVFADDMGAMIVHVQRENGLAHRTFVLRSWQVRLVRTLASRWSRLVLALLVLSWGYLAFQTARVPLLTSRIADMEVDAVRLDTLQQTIRDLQARYDQVQAMLSQPPAAAAGSRIVPTGQAAATKRP